MSTGIGPVLDLGARARSVATMSSRARAPSSRKPGSELIGPVDVVQAAINQRRTPDPKVVSTKQNARLLLAQWPYNKA